MEKFNLENEKIVEVNVEDEIKQSFLDYSMSVIVSRALPDVRDGLKPVHRRILYSMDENGLTHEKPTRKCATIVGSVLGAYHPHGDSSVYGALVRLAQSFSMRYPLVEGQGNFGSVDGDPPAAYRYTEARMSKLSNLLLENIDKDTVDFSPNFDEKREEPVVLPTRIPTLLINGSSGIAVGMATNIPPHNLTEVLDGVVAQIDNPDISVEELMEYIQGPDFPTKASIIGKSGIRAAYATGKGRIIIRAKCEIEEHRDGTSSIIVTELPYQVNKKVLVESIAEMVKEKRIEGLSDIEDHSSDRVGIRLEIVLKRDANPNVVLNQLFKYTRLQDSFSINMLAICDGKPKTLGLKEILANFISFQEEIVTRRTRYDLQKAEARMHILEGLRIALSNIDEVIHIIRNSYDDAKERLMERFSMSEIQAQSVLDMRLAQLQRLNGEKIEQEYNELLAKCEEYRALLADRNLLMEKIKDELIAIRDKYGDERLTEILPFDGQIDIEDEDLIPVEECVYTLTHYGYIKRLPSSTYRAQRRGGKGIAGLKTREEDFVETLFVASSHDHILFFTNKGRLYRVKGYQIPESSRTAKGMNIVNLIPIEGDEKVTAMIPIHDFEEGKYLVMATKLGIVKRIELTRVQSARKAGIRAVTIGDGDELISVMLTDSEKELMLATRNGMAIRFSEQDIRPTGRDSAGVYGIDLRQDDYVVGAAVVEDGKTILTVTENGYGKKTDIEEYRLQSRYGKGILNYNITEKTGKVAGVQMVSDNDDVMLISDDGVIIRMPAEGISVYSRVTQGVILMRLSEDVHVISVASTEKEEEAVEETAETPAEE